MVYESDNKESQLAELPATRGKRMPALTSGSLTMNNGNLGVPPQSMRVGTLNKQSSFHGQSIVPAISLSCVPRLLLL